MTAAWRCDEDLMTRPAIIRRMHLLIPFAAPHSEPGLQALRTLRLPHLARLLAHLTPAETIGSDEYSLTPPHELARAMALGWAAEDGSFPWAAHQAAHDGVAVGEQAWGLLTPVHWHVGSDHISLPDPQALDLSAEESRTFFEAVKPLFETEGWQMAWGAPLRWYAAHESLEGLPCASLDRVVGRNIDLWLPASPQARLIRRLQNEVQMLLYQLPMNDARTEQGRMTVNSFWLSGCGRARPERHEGSLRIAEGLRRSALASDWPAWEEAWRTLDAGSVKEALEAVQAGTSVTLTLCGERLARRFVTQPRGLLSRLGARWSSPPVAPVLEAL